MEIRIENGRKAFGENEIFKDINLTFTTGNFYLIKGYNGSRQDSFIKNNMWIYVFKLW